MISSSVFKDSIFEGLAGASLGNILVKVNSSLVDEKVNGVRMREMVLACGQNKAKSKQNGNQYLECNIGAVQGFRLFGNNAGEKK